jgi:hypothetical protein
MSASLVDAKRLTKVSFFPTVPINPLSTTMQLMLVISMMIFTYLPPATFHTTMVMTMTMEMTTQMTTLMVTLLLVITMTTPPLRQYQHKPSS